MLCASYLFPKRRGWFWARLRLGLLDRLDTLRRRPEPGRLKEGILDLSSFVFRCTGCSDPEMSPKLFRLSLITCSSHEILNEDSRFWLVSCISCRLRRLHEHNIFRHRISKDLKSSRANLICKFLTQLEFRDKSLTRSSRKLQQFLSTHWNDPVIEAMERLAWSWLILLNHDTWNACQDHDKIMARSSRSWQDLDKITMICHGSYQGYHVKNSIKPFSVIDRIPTSWKACLWMWRAKIISEISKNKRQIASKIWNKVWNV